ncbi:MAG: FecR domain-containing protein [Oligoflexia bacterium]|nr:FecR domain-containing protein [Oligoflexia bacterium]
MKKVVNMSVMTFLLCTCSFNLSALDPEAEMRKQLAKFSKSPPPSASPDTPISEALGSLKHPWIGIITDIEGKVIITRHSYTDKDQHRTFNAGKLDFVHFKDEITVGDASNVEIALTNKNKIKLAPKTIFKIHQHLISNDRQTSLFNLLMGTARASVKKLMQGSSYRMYTPNATIGVRGTEFIASYSENSKSTKVACYDGTVAINTSTAENFEADKTPGETELTQGKFTEVSSTYGEDGKIEPVIEKFKPITRKIDGVISRSFYTSNKQEKPWDFTEVSTGLARFYAGYEYFHFGEYSSSNFGVYYSPVFLIISSLYLEPYFGTFFSASGDSTFTMRAGTMLNLSIYRGLYLGAGGEMMWINSDIGNFAPGFTLTLGYSLLNKLWKIIDGVKFLYTYNSINDLVKSSSLHFGIVFSLTEGRHHW